MTLIFNRSRILVDQYEATFANAASIDTGSIDMSHVDKYQYTLRADSIGLTFTIQSRNNASQPWTTAINFITDTTLELLSVVPNQKFVRFTVTNNTGSTVNNVSLEVKGSYGSADKASVAPLNVTPVAQTQGMFTQSIIRGQDTAGVYRNLQLNQAGAALFADFGTEVARRLYNGYSIRTKYGRNPLIDIGTAPEDLWNGGSLYTGFNATANQNISVFSASANDVGSLVTSGTATGGSATTLINTSATFITNGVAVGDLIINDTAGIHGTVTAVNSEIQLTVFSMHDGGNTTLYNSPGDTYRIARATSTGAAVLRLLNPLNAAYEEQGPKYVILNGVTPVTLTGSFMRCDTGRVVKAGSNGRNVGVITVRQAVTTANVFCQIPTTGRTTIGVYTVPTNKVCIVKRISCGISRASGAGGSAQIVFYSREVGGAFNGDRSLEITTSTRFEENNIGGLVYAPGTDLKFTIEQVSDNGTAMDGEFEYFLIDKM